MKWTFFAGGALLTVLFLLASGAPLGPLLVGIGLAGGWNYVRRRRAG